VVVKDSSVKNQTIGCDENNFRLFTLLTGKGYF